MLVKTLSLEYLLPMPPGWRLKLLLVTLERFALCPVFLLFVTAAAALLFMRSEKDLNLKTLSVAVLRLLLAVSNEDWSNFGFAFFLRSIGLKASVVRVKEKKEFKFKFSWGSTKLGVQIA